MNACNNVWKCYLANVLRNMVAVCAALFFAHGGPYPLPCWGLLAVRLLVAYLASTVTKAAPAPSGRSILRSQRSCSSCSSWLRADPAWMRYMCGLLQWCYINTQPHACSLLNFCISYTWEKLQRGAETQCMEEEGFIAVEVEKSGRRFAASRVLAFVHGTCISPPACCCQSSFRGSCCLAIPPWHTLLPLLVLAVHLLEGLGMCHALHIQPELKPSWPLTCDTLDFSLDGAWAHLMGPGLNTRGQLAAPATIGQMHADCCQIRAASMQSSAGDCRWILAATKPQKARTRLTWQYQSAMHCISQD